MRNMPLSSEPASLPNRCTRVLAEHFEEVTAIEQDF
jgi:hypothetical protein